MQLAIQKNYPKELILILLSVVFLILNLMTLSWDTIPWLDEIMMTDTAVNFHLDGNWITTAWYDGGDQSPFSTYPPLYQFLLVLWMKLFGFSLFAVKSLNIFLTFGISLIGLSLLKKIKPDLHTFQVITFMVLFWTAGIFATIYRFGRVDVLNIFCSLLFLQTAFDYIRHKKQTYSVVLSSIFVLFSGIQACIFVVLVLFWAYLFYSEYRKQIRAVGLYFVFGSFITLLFLLGFFYYHDHLFAFLVSLVSYSSSLKRVAILLLPIIGPWFNLDVASIIAKVAPQADAPSFREELFANYGRNPDYLILIGMSIALLIFLKFTKQALTKETNVILSFSMAVPLFMSLAGRYVIYYTWMGYLPSLFAFILLTQYVPFKHMRSLLLLFSMVIFAYTGLPKELTAPNFNQNTELEHFIQKQKFDDQDCIVAPFSVYYSLRAKSQHAYFIGIYPPDYIPMEVNYLITDTIDYDGKLAAYKTQALEEGKTVNLMDQSNILNLKVYRIE